METDKSTTMKAHGPQLSLRDQFLVGAKNVFGLDLRSLAAFRIALGLLLLSDLVLPQREP